MTKKSLFPNDLNLKGVDKYKPYAIGLFLAFFENIIHIIASVPRAIRLWWTQVVVISRIIYIEIDQCPAGRAPVEFLLFRLEN